MPMTPGFGQQPRFLLTVQPTGVHFDPPAAISFPERRPGAGALRDRAAEARCRRSTRRSRRCRPRRDVLGELKMVSEELFTGGPIRRRSRLGTGSRRGGYALLSIRR